MLHISKCGGGMWHKVRYSPNRVLGVAKPQGGSRTQTAMIPMTVLFGMPHALSSEQVYC
jgi:hypothetical protein